MTRPKGSGDTLKHREVAPGVYQCGCRWIRAEEDKRAFKAGVRGDVLQLCPLHEQWNERTYQAMNEKQKATVGRTVLYTYQEADLPVGKRHLAGEVRPAVVVRVWPNEYPQDGTCGEDGYNIRVFTDGANDGFTQEESVLWKTSIRLADEVLPGTCHWPPRV